MTWSARNGVADAMMQPTVSAARLQWKRFQIEKHRDPDRGRVADRINRSRDRRPTRERADQQRPPQIFRATPAQVAPHHQQPEQQHHAVRHHHHRQVAKPLQRHEQQRGEQPRDPVDQLRDDQVQHRRARGGDEHRQYPVRQLQPHRRQVHQRSAGEIDRGVDGRGEDVEGLEMIRDLRRQRRQPQAAVRELLHLQQVHVLIVEFRDEVAVLLPRGEEQERDGEQCDDDRDDRALGAASADGAGGR